MGYEEDYYNAPNSLPNPPIRALFSELSNHLLWDEETPEDQQEAMETLREITKDERYQVSREALMGKVESDYKATCEWWEEEWRYAQAWPLIKELFEDL